MCPHKLCLLLQRYFLGESHQASSSVPYPLPKNISFPFTPTSRWQPINVLTPPPPKKNKQTNTQTKKTQKTENKIKQQQQQQFKQFKKLSGIQIHSTLRL